MSSPERHNDGDDAVRILLFCWSLSWPLVCLHLLGFGDLERAQAGTLNKNSPNLSSSIPSSLSSIFNVASTYSVLEARSSARLLISWAPKHLRSRSRHESNSRSTFSQENSISEYVQSVYTGAASQVPLVLSSMLFSVCGGTEVAGFWLQIYLLPYLYHPFHPDQILFLSIYHRKARFLEFIC